MKTFLEISNKVSIKGYGRFLSYLLVKKWLEEKIKMPDMIVGYSDIDFHL